MPEIICPKCKSVNKCPSCTDYTCPNCGEDLEEEKKDESRRLYETNRSKA